MPIESRAALESLISDMASQIGSLVRQLDQANADTGILRDQLIAVAQAQPSQGPTGSTGPAGPQGSTGPAGPQGSTGPAGDSGTAFTATSEFRDIQSRLTLAAQRDTDQDRALTATAVRVDGVAGQYTALQRSLEQTAASVSGFQAIPGPAGSPGARGDRGDIGPTGPKGDPGTIGPAGPALPVDAVNVAVATYLVSNPPAAGAQGPAGPSGTSGAQGPAGPPPTTDQVRGVVESVFAGLGEFVRDPTEYIWRVILGGIGKRLGALFDAIVGGLE